MKIIRYWHFTVNMYCGEVMIFTKWNFNNVKICHTRYLLPGQVLTVKIITCGNFTVNFYCGKVIIFTMSRYAILDMVYTTGQIFEAKIIRYGHFTVNLYYIKVIISTTWNFNILLKIYHNSLLGLGCWFCSSNHW
jgi:hypothetical protein